MGRLITSLIVALWFMYIGIMYLSEPVIILAFGILIFLLLSIVDLVFRFWAVSAQIVIPISTVDTGENVTIRVRVNNRSVLPVSKMRYEIATRNLLLPGSTRQKMYGELLSPGKNSLSFSAVPLEPGNYEVELKAVYIYNMTGTFFVKKRIKKSAFLQVNPKLTSAGVSLTEVVKNFYGESDIYNDLRPGIDPGETFRIREFKDGDKLQRIHWKLSVKMDEMMVKENSDPKSAPVVIFLNYEVPSSKKINTVEAFLGVGFGLSFSLMDAGCVHFVSWYSGTRKDVVRVRVYDEESFYFMMAAFLSDSYERPQEQLADLYGDRFRGERYVYGFELNAGLQLTKNKMEICRFTNSDSKWKEEFEKLEIII